jgi:hypothetical protein
MMHKLNDLRGKLLKQIKNSCQIFVMKVINLFLFLFIALILQACSMQQIHTMIQQNQKQECQSVPNSQYNECMERANENYDEYSNSRKEVIEDKQDS